MKVKSDLLLWAGAAALGRAIYEATTARERAAFAKALLERMGGPSGSIEVCPSCSKIRQGGRIVVKPCTPCMRAARAAVGAHGRG
jgi:hypothetical protein